MSPYGHREPEHTFVLDKTMIISVSGLGYSGSGAVLDLLKEYDENYVFDKCEFSLLYIPDGIMDLRTALCHHHFRFMSCDVAIRRFLRRVETFRPFMDPMTNGLFYRLANDYLNSFIQIKWKGSSFIHRVDSSACKNFFKDHILNPMRFRWEKRLGRKISLLFDDTMYFSVVPEDFEKRTTVFLEKLLEALLPEGTPQKNVILDQFFPGNNPLPCMELLPASKTLVVKRDPRDVYILAKKFLRSKAGFIPVDSVGDFIHYYRALDYPAEVHSDQLLVVRFEDLVYAYDTTCKRIEQFLGIGRHTSPLKFFNPQISIHNTRLFEKYADLQDDIFEIGRCLPDSLYPFPPSVYVSDSPAGIF